MKRIPSIVLSLFLTVTLGACSSVQAPRAGQSAPALAADDGNSAGSAAAAEAAQPDSGKILIAYFTVPETDGVDTVASASRVVVDSATYGNTEFIAREIQANLGGDLFAIRTEQAYPGSHDPLLEFAYHEKQNGARPALASQLANLEDYDVIFLGYPNWNADLPMPLYSFLEEYDFAGKTIIPFVTHGGSGFSNTVQTIQQLKPDAVVSENGLSVSRGSVANARDEVKAWADTLSAGPAGSPE